MNETEYIVASDLAKLRIARAAIADTMPGCWTDEPSYIRKLECIDVLKPLDNLIAEAAHIVSKQHEEVHNDEDRT